MNLLDNDLVGTIGIQKYRCSIQWRNGVFVMDEPERIEGRDLGPDPYTVFLASLAGCTLSTLRMYIDGKGWTIPEITVKINMHQSQEKDLTTFIEREIVFGYDITAEQRERLLLIAKKCPVSKIMENNIQINTRI